LNFGVAQFGFEGGFGIQDVLAPQCAGIFDLNFFIGDADPDGFWSGTGNNNGVIAGALDFPRQVPAGVGVPPAAGSQPPVNGDLPTTIKRPENSAPLPVISPEQNPRWLCGDRGSTPGGCRSIMTAAPRPYPDRYF